MNSLSRNASTASGSFDAIPSTSGGSTAHAASSGVRAGSIRFVEHQTQGSQAPYNPQNDTSPFIRRIQQIFSAPDDLSCINAGAAPELVALAKEATLNMHYTSVLLVLKATLEKRNDEVYFCTTKILSARSPSRLLIALTSFSSLLLVH
jgi:hypothetical protein